MHIYLYLSICLCVHCFGLSNRLCIVIGAHVLTAPAHPFIHSLCHSSMHAHIQPVMGAFQLLGSDLCKNTLKQKPGTKPALARSANCAWLRCLCLFLARVPYTSKAVKPVLARDLVARSVEALKLSFHVGLGTIFHFIGFWFWGWNFVGLVIRVPGISQKAFKVSIWNKGSKMLQG